MLLLRPDARDTGLFDLLLEFKYLAPQKLGNDAQKLEVLSRSALSEHPVVQEAFDRAVSQVKRYREGIEERFGDTLRLRSWAVVAVGLDRLVAREVGED